MPLRTTYDDRRPEPGSRCPLRAVRGDPSLSAAPWERPMPPGNRRSPAGETLGKAPRKSPRPVGRGPHTFPIPGREDPWGPAHVDPPRFRPRRGTRSQASGERRCGSSPLRPALSLTGSELSRSRPETSAQDDPGRPRESAVGSLRRAWRPLPVISTPDAVAHRCGVGKGASWPAGASSAHPW